MGGRRVTGEQKLTIDYMATRGASSRQIQAALREASPDDTSPDHGTIAKYMRRVPKNEPIRPWGPGWPSDPQEVAYLFRLLELTERLSPPFPSLDLRTAAWASKLRTALGPAETDDDLSRHYFIAWLYAEREREARVLGEAAPDTADLDAVLKHRPWESEERQKAYQEAVESGRVPKVTITKVLQARASQDQAALWQIPLLIGWSLSHVGDLLAREELSDVERNNLSQLRDFWLLGFAEALGLDEVQQHLPQLVQVVQQTKAGLTGAEPPHVLRTLQLLWRVLDAAQEWAKEGQDEGKPSPTQQEELDPHSGAAP